MGIIKHNVTNTKEKEYFETKGKSLMDGIGERCKLPCETCNG